MSIKKVRQWVMSLFVGGMLVVAPAAALAAIGGGFGGGVRRFDAVVDPATFEATPGSHVKLKKADDDDDDGGDFDFGFGFGNPWGWGGWYGSPYWGPSVQYYYAPTPHRRTGELKVDTHHRNAEVFIDGAYAGTIRNKDKFPLRPGSYRLEVRTTSGRTFDTQVYVTRGKTLTVRPDFAQAG